MIQKLLQIAKEQPLKKYESTKEWAADYFYYTRHKTPVEKAIIGGFMCQQFSFAFMAGYQAALEKMFPMIAPNKLKALCVSEEKGGHPKAIQASLINNEIAGIKTYVTAGSEAEHLLVLCKTKEIVNGRPLLKMVELSAETENTEIVDFTLPFMQDVKHGKLVLQNVKISSDQILKGDAYIEYTKPFRTFEDICIGLAYQAMFLRQAIDTNWEEDLRDQLLFNIYALKNLLELPPSDKETHILLAVYDTNFKRSLPIIESHIAKYAPDYFKKDWMDNKKVLSLSKKLKEIRLSKARNTLFA